MVFVPCISLWAEFRWMLRIQRNSGTCSIFLSRAAYSLLLPVSMATAHQTWHLSGIWELCRVIQTSMQSPTAFCHPNPLQTQHFLPLVPSFITISLFCFIFSSSSTKLSTVFPVGLSLSLCWNAISFFSLTILHQTSSQSSLLFSPPPCI